MIIPNIFTPNDDDFNNCYRVDGIGADCYSFELRIYNRWGDLIYESEDVDSCWAGIDQSSGKEYPEGTYFSVVKIRQIDADFEEEISGTITLIR